MILYLLRHGKADWLDWKGSDDDRPLNDEGVKEMRIVAAALNRLKMTPDFILSSPLPRALKTAEIVAKELDLPVAEQASLSPGFDRRKCDALLASQAGADVVMVGHEPDLSGIVRSLTGGRVKFSKAATAAIEISDDMPGARILWLFPAKTLIRLTGKG